MTKHKHAELMMQYAQDALETERPWERWEFKTKMEKWLSCGSQIIWQPEWEYRRNIKTININGFDVPEPMQEAPRVGTRYYYVSFSNKDLVDSFKWDGNAFDRALMKTGTCHSTKKTAEIHAKALLSFTEQK